MSIQSTYLTTTANVVYTSSGTTASMTFYMANYSTSANANFSIWAVPNGGTPSNLNVLYSNVRVTAGDTYLASTERLILDNGDSLYAYCSANNVMSVTLTHTPV
mgnify:CR=1 FL=1|jgi:hypothetical protein